MNDYFLQSLAKECLSYGVLVGQTIRHKNFGDIEIISINNKDKQVKISLINGVSCYLSEDSIIDDFKDLNHKEIKNFEVLLKKEKQKFESEIEKKKKEEILRIEKERLNQIKLEKIEKKKRQKNNNFLCVDIVLDALNDSFKEVEIIPPVPNTNDYKLIECWTKTKKDSEKRRLLSARLAEIAVINFFETQGKKVEDISITQISNNPNPEWKNYDLLIDGYPVDVKNATRSKIDKDRYVEHCIPKFKEDRDLKPVTIAGVLSYWLPSFSKTHSFDHPLLFLGTTTKQKHQQLKNEFSKGHLIVSFNESSRDNKNFLPPWIYNYPEYLYKSSNKYLEKIKKLPIPDWKICQDEGINILPVYITLGIEYAYNPEMKFSKFQKEFISNLSSRIIKLKERSLSIVFLSILEHFLSVLMSNSFEENYHPDDYRELIFPKTENIKRPLFLYDPLNTIDSLIKCLVILWEEKVNSLKDFNIFELQSLNILRGKRNTNDKDWTTILAYCGGWNREENRPCGNIPLIFGREKTCQQCGHLICNKCNFCSISCRPNSNDFLNND